MSPKRFLVFVSLPPVSFRSSSDNFTKESNRPFISFSKLSFDAYLNLDYSIFWRDFYLFIFFLLDKYYYLLFNFKGFRYDLIIKYYLIFINNFFLIINIKYLLKINNIIFFLNNIFFIFFYIIIINIIFNL